MKKGCSPFLIKSNGSTVVKEILAKAETLVGLFC
jgi:hypothetical protein